MSDESYDRQRDIEAEGQRAALYYAEKDRKAMIPAGRERLVGISHEGRPVDNVTVAKRFDVDPQRPWIMIHLLNESQSQTIGSVYIPNTRERPDVVRFKGEVYEVVTTRVAIPCYRLVMALDAVVAPPDTGETR